MEYKQTAVQWLWKEWSDLMKSSIDSYGRFIISEEQYIDKLVQLFNIADKQLVEDLINGIDKAKVNSIEGKKYVKDTYGIHIENIYLN
jgi:hypothetical protein